MNLKIFTPLEQIHIAHQNNLNVLVKMLDNYNKWVTDETDLHKELVEFGVDIHWLLYHIISNKRSIPYILLSKVFDNQYCNIETFILRVTSLEFTEEQGSGNVLLYEKFTELTSSLEDDAEKLLAIYRSVFNRGEYSKAAFNSIIFWKYKVLPMNLIEQLRDEVERRKVSTASPVTEDKVVESKLILFGCVTRTHPDFEGGVLSILSGVYVDDEQESVTAFTFSDESVTLGLSNEKNDVSRPEVERLMKVLSGHLNIKLKSVMALTLEIKAVVLI